ncbi:MAG TPA: MAPEG family protein [Steroidobacteraceae bacterium]|jgi:glutathione S-transferase|nr:MAPEG family protein [Steroidobacteraceae bacterium]
MQVLHNTLMVHLVVAVALLEFLFFGFAVGKARETYGVKAPATSGNEMFERYHRVQMNTLELLVVFIPAIQLFALYVDARIAAALGLVFVIGRAWYFRQYIRDPSKRSVPFGVSFLPVVILLLGALIGAALHFR